MSACSNDCLEYSNELLEVCLGQGQTQTFCSNYASSIYNSCLSDCSLDNNVVDSINGANVVLNDQVIANEIGEPMFFWYGQLLNVAITFVPVFVVISCFWLIYGWLKNLNNKNSLDSKKSLDNK